MTPFEYVTVLVSIVLGLGITQVVTGIADIIHNWERVKLYWPHILWIILVFFLQIQEWWLLYGLRQHMEWRLPTFLFTILYPINLFILARILFPASQEQGTIDVKIFYFANYRKFFLLMAILPALSFIENIAIHDYPPGDQYFHLMLFSIMTFGAVRGFAQEWIHKFIVVTFLVVVTISVAVNWDEWTLRM